MKKESPLPLERSQLDWMFVHIVQKLSDSLQDCDHTLKHTTEFLQKYFPDEAEATLAFCEDNGGHCDCEVLWNVRTNVEEFYPRTEDQKYADYNQLTMHKAYRELYAQELKKSEFDFQEEPMVGTWFIQMAENRYLYATPFWEDARGLDVNVLDDDESDTQNLNGILLQGVLPLEIDTPERLAQRVVYLIKKVFYNQMQTFTFFNQN